MLLHGLINLMHHKLLTGFLALPIKLLREVLGEVLVEPDFDLASGGEADHIIIDVYWTLPLEDDLKGFEGLLEDIVALGQRHPKELC